jgi:TolA-binding protein
MRLLTALIVLAGLTIVPATRGRTNHDGEDADTTQKDGPAEPTLPDDPGAVSASQPASPEMEQLRHLVTSQSEQLRDTREQLQKLQQRMEVLERGLHVQAVSSLEQQLGGQPPTSEPRLNGVVGNHTSVATNGAPFEAITLRQTGAAPGAEVSSSAAPSAANTSPQATTSEQRSDSIQLANGKVRIGTLLYADYSYYTKTGFGPQFVSQINPPGPRNNGYNTFEINRAYLNVYYSPTDAVTFRLTPELYRQIGTAPAAKIGKVTALGQNADQQLPFRLKYAYLEFNNPFAHIESFRKDKLTVGMQQSPLIEWEERIYGFRYINTVPWDFLGFSPALLGASLHGPIEFNGKQYLDYAFGVYNNASYKSLEQSEKKQAMARLTYYPFGARSDLDGLGFTGFYDYGYTNVTPDSGINFPLYRASTLVHFTSKKNAYSIAGEFDAGRNAYTSSNFFSGNAPLDEYGLGTTQYAGFDALTKAILNINGAKQRGYALLGHAVIPRSPFTVFATFQSLSPNVNVAKNPLDFHRVVGGVSYRFSDRLRFAIASQNLLFRHTQFTFPASQIQLLSPALAAANPNGIANAVPNRIQAIFADTEFRF